MHRLLPSGRHYHRNGRQLNGNPLLIPPLPQMYFDRGAGGNANSGN